MISSKIANHFAHLDKTVQARLLRYLRSLNRNVQRMGTIIDLAITWSNKCFSTDMRKLEKAYVSIDEDFAFSYKLFYAKTYVRIILSQDTKYAEMARNIHFYGALLFVGAGISFESGLPLVGCLKQLVCKALDQVNNSIDWKSKWNSDSDSCWNELEKPENEKALRYFKTQFANLSREEKPSDSHRIVAQLFEEGRILETLCVNWDDLIERAYTQLTGKAMYKITSEGVSRSHSLWKLHGDVEKLDEPWVLPNNKKGRVFNSLIEFLRSLDRPTVFIIIGYSESEENISNQIVKELQRNRETYRIRPDLDPELKSEDHIIGTAEYALSTIKDIISAI